LRRLYPAAAAEADPFITARKTGVEPRTGLPPTAGLRTYPESAPELLAVPKSGTPSAGVAMRAEEGMRRLLRVHDTKAHGHAATAEETLSQYDRQLKAQAGPHWSKFDKAAETTSMRAEKGLQDFVAKWEAEASRAGVAGTSKARAINSALDEVAPKVGKAGRQISDNANDVHFGKQVIDDQVENYLKAAPGSTQRQLGGLVNQMKNDLVDAIKGVKTNNLGSHYERGSFYHGGGQETKRQVRMGQDLWAKAHDAEEVNNIRERFAAMSRAEQKRVKLGFVSGYMHDLAGKPIGTDPSRLVSTRERERILDWLVEKGGDVFGDRPQRGRAFMKAIARERETENIVMRGSPTAERTAMDKLTNDLHGITDVLKTAASGQVRSAIMQAGELALTRMFGMRAEVAAEQMRMLASASKEENARTIAALQMYLGRSRAERFAAYMGRVAARHQQATLPAITEEAAE